MVRVTSTLAGRWMEIYRAEFHRLRAEGYTEDQATALAGKYAYEQCDRDLIARRESDMHQNR